MTTRIKAVLVIAAGAIVALWYYITSQNNSGPNPETQTVVGIQQSTSAAQFSPAVPDTVMTPAAVAAATATTVVPQPVTSSVTYSATAPVALSITNGQVQISAAQITTSGRSKVLKLSNYTMYIYISNRFSGDSIASATNDAVTAFPAFNGNKQALASWEHYFQTLVSEGFTGVSPP